MKFSFINSTYSWHLLGEKFEKENPVSEEVFLLLSGSDYPTKVSVIISVKITSIFPSKI